jgi:hypothetical protein
MRKQTIAQCLLMIGAVMGIVPLAVFLSAPMYVLGLWLLWTAPIDRSMKWKWTLVPLSCIAAVWLLIVGVSKALHV